MLRSESRRPWMAMFAFSLAMAFIATAPSRASATGYQIAVEAGKSGNVSTLQCYDPNPNSAHPYYSTKPNPFAPCRYSDDNLDGVTGTHTGSFPIDITGSGTVYLQLDYLPSRDRGGYTYVQDTSGYCSSWVGKTALVWVYHFDPTGTYDVHDTYFEHMNMSVAFNYWYLWNNYYSSAPLWILPDFSLNNTTSGGWAIGSVATPAPGTPPGCATGTHLHQDVGSSHSAGYNVARYAEGCFYDGGYWGGARCPTNPGIWAWVTGEPVTGRYSDTQFLWININ